MVDIVSPVLKAAAVPMSHTATGVLKVEIMGTLLVAGVLIATYGFWRWNKMSYEDWLIIQKRDELLESGMEINMEDYELPLRSHIVSYLFIGLGAFLAIGGLATWLIIPA